MSAPTIDEQILQLRARSTSNENPAYAAAIATLERVRDSRAGFDIALRSLSFHLALVEKTNARLSVFDQERKDAIEIIRPFTSYAGK